jgi:hypothetical protein
MPETDPTTPSSGSKVLNELSSGMPLLFIVLKGEQFINVVTQIVLKRSIVIRTSPITAGSMKSKRLLWAGYVAVMVGIDKFNKDSY